HNEVPKREADAYQIREKSFGTSMCGGVLVDGGAHPHALMYAQFRSAHRLSFAGAESRIINEARCGSPLANQMAHQYRPPARRSSTQPTPMATRVSRRCRCC